MHLASVVGCFRMKIIVNNHHVRGISWLIFASFAITSTLDAIKIKILICDQGAKQ